MASCQNLRFQPLHPAGVSKASYLPLPPGFLAAGLAEAGRIAVFPVVAGLACTTGFLGMVLFPGLEGATGRLVFVVAIEVIP
jgi:hypothetical protein